MAQEGYGDAFPAAVETDKLKVWLEKAWLRSAAAVIVGALALAAVLCDSRSLRIAAASAGLLLPALHLVLLGVFHFLLKWIKWNKRLAQPRRRH